MHYRLQVALIWINTALATKPVTFLSATPRSWSSVAHTLAQVEQRWLNWAVEASALDCDVATNATTCIYPPCGHENITNCTTHVTKGYAFGNFTQSCQIVSKAIVMTSAGDRTRVQVSMSKVCSQDALKGKRFSGEELCLDFSKYITREMSEYQHANVEGSANFFRSANLSSVCFDFFHNGFARYVGQEQQARLADQAAMEAQEAAKKAQEQSKAEEKAQAEVEARAPIVYEHVANLQNLHAFS